MPTASETVRNACPLCKKPTEPAFKPFCSQGCRDRDLLNWLGDAYHLPGRAIEDEDLSSLDTGGLDKPA